MYEKYSTRGVSQGKYSTQLHLVLYLPLDTPPRAVFPIHTRGSALTIQYGMVMQQSPFTKRLKRAYACGGWSVFTEKVLWM